MLVACLQRNLLQRIRGDLSDPIELYGVGTSANLGDRGCIEYLIESGVVGNATLYPVMAFGEIPAVDPNEGERQ